MIVTAKWILILFGVFLIAAGLLMLFAPAKARAYIRKAGSNNLINYGEITLRMLPAAALVLYAEHSKFPQAFAWLGWFMLITSLVLFFVPKKMHNRFAVWGADMLSNNYFRLTAPFSMLFGLIIIYATL